ncbi:MAG: hypothetical protein HRU14_18470, partial [Planctomycetes bacterium]|nr:hypothetical protein [Planctomycetota bacterium]
MSYYFSADSSTGLTWIDPPNGESYSASVALSVTSIASEDFETSSGWSVGAPGDDASPGIWIQANPLGPAAQPEDDHTVAGALCFFTGQGSPGGSTGENDVDGGKTTLTTPSYNLVGLSDPRISYWRWYSNSAGPSPEADIFLVDISSNGGATWTNVGENLPGVNNEVWVNRIEPSHHAACTAYVVLDNHRFDDMDPHVYVTRDMGATFTDVTGNLPGGIGSYVVVEDPVNPNLLFLGT